MSDDFLKATLESLQNVTFVAMKSGQEIGFRDGMIFAAELCEKKAKIHAEYLRLGPNQQYRDTGDLADAATCGRRDECTNLAYEIRHAMEKPLGGI